MFYIKFKQHHLFIIFITNFLFKLLQIYRCYIFDYVMYVYYINKNKVYKLNISNNKINIYIN
jgi:hypothetical protein